MSLYPIKTWCPRPLKRRNWAERMPEPRARGGETGGLLPSWPMPAVWEEGDTRGLWPPQTVPAAWEEGRGGGGDSSGLALHTMWTDSETCPGQVVLHSQQSAEVTLGGKRTASRRRCWPVVGFGVHQTLGGPVCWAGVSLLNFSRKQVAQRGMDFCNSGNKHLCLAKLLWAESVPVSLGGK